MPLQVQELDFEHAGGNLLFGLSAECVCCGREERVQAEDAFSQDGAMRVLHLRGWRRVLSRNEDNTVACPRCVAELIKISEECNEQ